jgi:hypothetical protein
MPHIYHNGLPICRHESKIFDAGFASGLKVPSCSYSDRAATERAIAGWAPFLNLYIRDDEDSHELCLNDDDSVSLYWRGARWFSGGYTIRPGELTFEEAVNFIHGADLVSVVEYRLVGYDGSTRYVPGHILAARLRDLAGTYEAQLDTEGVLTIYKENGLRHCSLMTYRVRRG